MSLAKYSKPLLLLLKIAVVAGIFWLISRGIDFSEIAKILRGQSREVFFYASFFLLMQILLGALRWRVILLSLARASDGFVSSYKIFKDYYISVFFNSCLPGTVGGDVVRVWLVKSDNVPLSMAASSVVADRIMALFALAVMGVLTMPFFASYLGVSLLLILPPMLIACIVGVWLLFNLGRFAEKVSFLKSYDWLLHFLQNIRFIISRPKDSLLSLVCGIAAHVNFCFAAYFLAKSLGGNIGMVQIITLVPWVLLVAVIPISIGGWGIREAAMIYLMALVGVSTEVALALSVQLGILSMLVTIPAGILWLMRRKG